MAEPVSAIPQGGDDNTNLQNLTDVPPGGEIPQVDPESAEALDALLKSATQTPEEKAAAEAKAAEEKAAAEAKAAEEKAAAEKKAAEEAAAKQTPEEKAAAEAKAAEEKAAAEKKAAEEKAAAEKKADDFDAIQLPPHSKPKSTEAFDKVKSLAREKIDAAAKELEAVKAKLAETEKLAKKGLPDEITKELEELRAFRLKMDVEADPSFKKFDATIASNVDLIYSKLRSAGIGEDSIKKIQELGGPGEVDWDALASKLPAPLKRYIEGKLFENEDLSEKKKQAIEAAKKNADEFLKTRQQEVEKSSETQRKATETEISNMLPQMPWLKEKEIPANAKPEEKSSAEAHNKFIADVQTNIKEALNDDSPVMKAILILGFAQLQKVRADLASSTASHKAEIAAKVGEIEKLGKELKEKSDLIARIQKSSGGGLVSSAPKGGNLATQKTAEPNIHESGADALDRLRLEAELKAS